jgi:hypothetical protein
MPTNQGDSQDSCAASWDTIEISFLTEYKLQISRNGSFEEPVGYQELGFEDRRSGKPDQAWGTLRALVEERGILRDGSSAGAVVEGGEAYTEDSEGLPGPFPYPRRSHSIH